MPNAWGMWHAAAACCSEASEAVVQRLQHEERSMQHAVAWVLGDCVSTRLAARGRVSAMASGRHVHNSCTRGAADATGSHGEGPVRHHGSLRHGSLQVSDDKSVVRLARAGWPAAAPNLWSSVSSYFLACLPRGCAGTSTKRWVRFAVRTRALLRAHALRGGLRAFVRTDAFDAVVVDCHALSFIYSNGPKRRLG